MSSRWLNNVSQSDLRRAQMEKQRETQAAEATTVESIPLSKSPSSSDSLLSNESLLLEQPKGYHDESLLLNKSLPSNNSLSNNLWASITEIKGHTRLPHAIIDKLFQLLDVPERVVYEQLFRLSWGFANPLCKVSLPTLSTRTGLGKSAVHAAIKRLESKGLVIKESYVFGRNREQATTYRLPLPEWLVRNESLLRDGRLSDGGSNKVNTLKETHNTETGVRVASSFTLAECRRYAESLRNDGITNPGGYATKIHRSGEADDLIAKFLNPPEVTPAVDARACPDCNGTGWRESNNPEQKGVIRCKHEKLSSG